MWGGGGGGHTQKGEEKFQIKNVYGRMLPHKHSPVTNAEPIAIGPKRKKKIRFHNFGAI